MKAPDPRLFVTDNSVNIPTDILYQSMQPKDTPEGREARRVHRAHAAVKSRLKKCVTREEFDRLVAVELAESDPS